MMFLIGFTLIQKATQYIYLMDSDRFVFFKVTSYDGEVRIFCLANKGSNIGLNKKQTQNWNFRDM